MENTPVESAVPVVAKSGSSIRENPGILDNAISPSAPVSKEEINAPSTYDDIDKYFPKHPQEVAPEPVAETPKKEEPKAKAEPTPEPAKPKGLADKFLKKEEPVKEQPKPEATNEEAPEDKITLDPKTGVKAREGFDQLKTITKQLREAEAKARTEVTELKARFEAQAKVAPITTEEIEKKDAAYKALADKIALYDLKAHPSYQQNFVQPKKQLIQAANELVAANKIEGVNLEALLALPRNELGKAISTITDQLPRFDAAEVEANIRDAYKIALAERDAESKASETIHNLKQQQQVNAVNAFTNTFKDMAPRITEFSPAWDVDSNYDAETKSRAEAYNNSLKSIRGKAEQYAFAVSDERVASSVAIKAAAYEHQVEHVMPNLVREMESLNRELNSARKELNAIKSHKPNRANFTTPNAGDSGALKPEEMSTAQAADHFFSK